LEDWGFVLFIFWPLSVCEKKDAAPIDGVERTAVPVFFLYGSIKQTGHLVLQRFWFFWLAGVIFDSHVLDAPVAHVGPSISDVGVLDSIWSTMVPGRHFDRSWGSSHPVH
jgi:hypothetical protein